MREDQPGVGQGQEPWLPAMDAERDQRNPGIGRELGEGAANIEVVQMVRRDQVEDRADRMRADLAQPDAHREARRGHE